MVGTCKPSSRVPSALTMELDIQNEQSVLLRSPRSLPPSLLFYHTPPHVSCHNFLIHTKRCLSWLLGKLCLPNSMVLICVQCLLHIYTCSCDSNWSYQSANLIFLISYYPRPCHCWRHGVCCQSSVKRQVIIFCWDDSF